MLYRDAEKVDNPIIGLANECRPVTLMTRAHRHNEIELNVVEVGAMTYLFGGSRVRVEPGQCALFWATTPHQTIQVEPNSLFHWLTVPFSLFLQWRLPETFAQQVICGKFVQYELGEQWQDVLKRLYRWHDDMRSKTFEHRKIVMLELEALLRRLILISPQSVLSPVSEESSTIAPLALNKVEQMACFIADNYTQSLHVEDIAVTVHLHPNYAMSLFRKYFGISITEYINQYRVAHAQRLLLISDANVSEIALDAGFGSVSRFYNVFKEACGQLPAEYRNGLRANLLPDDSFEV